MRDVAIYFRIQKSKIILLIMVRKKRSLWVKNILLHAKNIATYFEID